MGRYEQDEIHDLLGGNYVAYNPRIAHEFGVNAALVLCQLLYWHGKGSRKDGWIFKTMEDMWLETGLSRTQQDNAIKKLKAAGVISVKRKGIPAKRHFKVHVRKLRTRLQENRKLYDG